MNVVQLTVRLSLCSAVVTAVTDSAEGLRSYLQSKKTKSVRLKNIWAVALWEKGKLSSFPIDGN